MESSAPGPAQKLNSVDPANEEATEAWNGPLFDRFVAFREIVTTGLGAHGERALATYPPRAGERVLDLGCGFGDTAQRLADLVGPEGSVVGIDVSERFIEAARAEVEQSGRSNLGFLVGDIQVTDLGGPYDYAFSRMGVMFFANPVAAMRNVREAMAPGGRLCSVVWRRKLDNEWLHRAEVVVSRFLDRNEDSSEPTCGPGPFSMADADTTSAILQSAGFEDVSFTRVDLDIKIGGDLDAALEFVMALGPAGELIRLAEDEGDRRRPEIEAALRESMAEYERSDGIYAPASTWVIGARAPAA